MEEANINLIELDTWDQFEDEIHKIEIIGPNVGLEPGVTCLPACSVVWATANGD